jgi:hypothetical protein
MQRDMRRTILRKIRKHLTLHPSARLLPPTPPASATLRWERFPSWLESFSKSDFRENRIQMCKTFERFGLCMVLLVNVPADLESTTILRTRGHNSLLKGVSTGPVIIQHTHSIRQRTEWYQIACISDTSSSPPSPPPPSQHLIPPLPDIPVSRPVSFLSSNRTR